MLEIKNKQKFPVQLMVKSTRGPRQFTTLIIPSIGSGNNVRYLADERKTENIEKAERDGLISTKYISNKSNKGE